MPVSVLGAEPQALRTSAVATRNPALPTILARSAVTLFSQWSGHDLFEQVAASQNDPNVLRVAGRQTPRRQQRSD